MRKQKLFLSIILLGLFFSFFSDSVLGAGSATVSWMAPTTDEGGGALTGLAGYRVYYDTSSHWASACPLDAGDYETVADGETESYFFNNSLTAGQTHYFTVVAYDDDNNISGCASDGTDTEISMVVTYSADIDAIPDHDVDLFDYNILHQYYGTTNSTADINNDGTVNLFDYNILHEDYGNSF